MSKSDEKYSVEEAQRRFMASLKAAVNTPPKPLKDRPRQQPKKKQAKKAPVR